MMNWLGKSPNTKKGGQMMAALFVFIRSVAQPESESSTFGNQNSAHPEVELQDSGGGT
jgi:hypothetical protein